MSLQTTRMVLKIEEAPLYKNQILYLLKGERKEVLFQLVKKDGVTGYDLTGKTVKMDWEKEDGTGVFGTDEDITVEAGTSGNCKWNLTTQLDNKTTDDYRGYIKIISGSDNIQVQETFLVMLRAGIPV